jgi:hypothetical protein
MMILKRAYYQQVSRVSPQCLWLSHTAERFDPPATEKGGHRSTRL